MSKIFYFTGENSIQSTQLIENAFGELPDEGNIERYNLENKFNVSPDSPAYAMTKSLVIAISDSSNSLLLNLALVPINSYTSGFPIKLFIYRGVRRSSLIDQEEKIQISDSSWDNNNILKVVKSVQDKINSINGTNDVANSDSLGLQFSTLDGNTYLEKLFFDDTDNFHPIIVDGGCQIGKFSGNSDLAGIEIIMDKIGCEPKLQLLKNSNHIFEIQKLVLPNNLTNQEKLIQKFNNRFQKEEVLAYLDVTAFYGATKNQGYRVKNINNNNDSFLEKFYNKNTVYVDIRDDWGYSFNHFFKITDLLPIGFYSNNSSDLVFNDENYYSKWPILKIVNQQYTNSKKYFFIKIPIKIGDPENINVISSYTGKISSIRDSSKKKHLSIYNGESRDNTVKLNNSETIKLKNWKYDDDKLGANYYLLKKSTKDYVQDREEISSIFDNIFSLKMNSLFGFEQIEDGEFRVNTYSSINNPIFIDTKEGVGFLPVVGIAVDKFNITFFMFKEEIVLNKSSKKQRNCIPILGKGKFKIKFNPDDFEFSNSEQNVGFLSQIVNPSFSKVSDYKLSKYSIEDPDDTQNLIKFLYYSRTSDPSENKINEVFNSFESVTFTHQEYNEMIIRQNNNSVIFPTHPIYINAIKTVTHEHTKFIYEEFNITTGEPKIALNDEDETLSYINLEPNPDVVTENGLPVTLNTVY